MDSIIEIAAAVRSGARTAVDVVDEALDRIARQNDRLTAFVFIDAEGARRSAEAIDRTRQAGGALGPLAGVPFGVKDMEDCAGMPTTHGSLFYRDAAPAAADSVHVARLRAAGAIPLGKTAAGEFGMDSGTYTRLFGATRNPWDVRLTPGGSSGGSAAAVSAGFVPFAVGSDGGGSIRAPAAFTGLVGLKPSHGRIPRASGRSVLSCLGALTTTVADTACYLDVVSGPHAVDRMALPPPDRSFLSALTSGTLEGKRVRWSSDLGFAAVDPEVAAIAEAAAHRVVAAGGLVLEDESFRLINAYLDWIALGVHEFRTELSVMGVTPAQLELLSLSPRRAVDLTGVVDDRRQYDARERMAQLDAEVGRLMEAVDFLITPTVACPAFGAESLPPTEIAGRDATGTGAEPFGIFANVSWCPSISLPAGVTASGCPVGVQITGPRHREDLLLCLAALYEAANPWARNAPGWD